MVEAYKDREERFYSPPKQESLHVRFYRAQFIQLALQF